MSTTALSYTRSRNAGIPNYPTTFSWYRDVDGIKATGLDRSKPHVFTLTEGRALQWRTLKSTGATVGSPINPAGKSAHEQKYLPFGGGFPSTVNKAYGRMVQKLNGEQSAIGAAAGEWRQSFGMIANRSMGLYRSYKALRKGDFGGFLNSLRATPHRRDKGRTRNAVSEASGLWLEYSFGWKPLVGDIYSACTQLSEPLPQNEKVFGRAETRLTKVYSGSTDQRIAYRFRCEQGARFALVNPNLYLAQQLGLANPALIAWELVPFSFLADWAFDVSSFIGSFSDFIGLSVVNDYTSQTTNCNWELYNTSGMDGRYRAAQVFMERRTSLTRPFPNLDIQANLGGTWQRAANGVALLGQILS